MMHALKKFFVHSPGHYISAVILTAAVAIFRFSSFAEGVSVRFKLYDSVSVAGFVTLLMGMLFTVSYWGAFDLFGYVFAPGKTAEGRRYRNYADYSNDKAQKRSRGNLYFVPYYVVGIVVCLASNLIA